LKVQVLRENCNFSVIMQLHPYIQNYLPSLERIFNKYKIEKVFLFGSLANGQFEAGSSDVDMQVSFSKDASISEKGQGFLNLYIELNELFGKKVDLITDDPIRNPFLRNSIERSKILIYDRTGAKAAA
jgi:uncharacterized protein